MTNSLEKRIAIIGGGAAGIFTAAHLLAFLPQSKVTVFEKSSKLLEKVRISGGGRCNVTHHCFNHRELASHYPRGEKLLKNLFYHFNPIHTIDWFKDKGVALKTEADGRMFPITDSSETIITALLDACKSPNCTIKLRTPVTDISKADGNRIALQTPSGVQNFDSVVVTTGGSPSKKGLLWLQNLGHAIAAPVPSLFTFNLQQPVSELMGVVAKEAQVRINGFDYKSTGPLLFTHWGLSGPAVLRLSAFAAHFLAAQQYHYTVHINWLGGKNDMLIRDLLSQQGQVKLKNQHFEGIPKRLWLYVLERATVNPELTWLETPKKNKNRLVNQLMDDQYPAKGKTTFKEEFVTAGGVGLTAIHSKTLESKAVPNLYFAGEVLDIDGVTGGFNFQAAWTTAFTVAQAIALK